MLIPMLLLLAYPVRSGFQNAPAQNPMTHQQEPESVIDGAVHPDQIPDLTAYRLWLIAVSLGPHPTNEDRQRQQAQLGMVGLGKTDQDILTKAISDFRASHDALAAQYDQTAAADHGQSGRAERAVLRKRMNALVESTLAMLRSRLSDGGLRQFAAFIQSEKKHMRIHAGAL